MDMFKCANRVAFFTISLKEIKRILRVWSQTLLPSVITTSLYFVIFGGVVGERIGEMGGFDYATYVLPGLVLMGLITNSFTNVAFSLFICKFNHSIEEVLISPVPSWIILLGFSVGGVARGVLIACIVLFISSFFTSFHVYSWSLTIISMLLTAFIFSLIGFINGLLGRSFDDVGIVPTFILTPLIYLGGVFYSVSVLPPFWQMISHFNPILYEVSAFRYGLLGCSDTIHIGYIFTFMIVFSIALFLFCLFLLKKGVGIRT